MPNTGLLCRICLPECSPRLIHRACAAVPSATGRCSDDSRGETGKRGPRGDAVPDWRHICRTGLGCVTIHGAVPLGTEEEGG